MLKLTDIRKTTRRSGSGDTRTIHPQFLRDRTLLPRVDLTLRHMESMLGRPRRDLDQEVIVQLFGDHKLARCIVAALATTYRHRARSFAEVLSPRQLAALAERRIFTPSDLRLWIYDQVNAQEPGFVLGAQRAAFLARTGQALELSVDEMERLLTLDALANAVLVRTGPVPTAADVLARCNFAIAATLLANASLVRLTLGERPATGPTMRQLYAQLGVRGDLAGQELVLHGQRDALDSWSRHGAQLVRLLSLLLSCGLSVRSGTATIMAPHGGEWLFRFDADVLAYLGGAASGSATPRYASQTCLSTWQSAAALVADFASTRRAGAADGWALRRVTEPLVVAAGVMPALCVGLRETERVFMVPAPTSDSESAALAELARRVPLVVVHLGAMPDEAAQDVQTTEWPVRFYWSERGDTHTLAERLRHATLAAARTLARSRMDEMLSEARQRGVLAERLIAERLACSEEELAERMREPTVRAELNGLDLGYVEGFGLCRKDVLARAHAAAAEVTHTREDQPVGPAWTARVLGRRLREVTGMGEGIECLIAYLGAA